MCLCAMGEALVQGALLNASSLLAVEPTGCFDRYRGKGSRCRPCFC